MATVSELLAKLKCNVGNDRLDASRELRQVIGPADADAVSELAEVLRDDYRWTNYDSWEVRQNVLIALGQIGPAAVPAVPLVKEALGHALPEVRGAAAEALAKINLVEAVAMWIAMVKAEQPGQMPLQFIYRKHNDG